MYYSNDIKLIIEWDENCVIALVHACCQVSNSIIWVNNCETLSVLNWQLILFDYHDSRNGFFFPLPNCGPH